MPLIEGKLFERRLEDPEIPKQIIKTLADGLCSVIGGQARDEIWVLVKGVSPLCWGIVGETADTR